MVICQLMAIGEADERVKANGEVDETVTVTEVSNSYKCTEELWWITTCRLTDCDESSEEFNETVFKKAQ